MIKKASPMPIERVLTLQGEANDNGKAIGPPSCPVCLSPVQGKGRFCKARCRLLSWAVYALADALRAGRAEGLRKRIRALAHAANGRRES